MILWYIRDCHPFLAGGLILIGLSDLDEDNTDTFWIIGKMQTDEQRETFKEFTEGSMVVIRGTITDITESTVSIDIDDME